MWTINTKPFAQLQKKLLVRKPLLLGGREFTKSYSKYYTTYVPNDKERSYIPYLLINEHLFMTLARDFGFSVQYNAIIKHSSDYHYIIKRFDR